MKRKPSSAEQGDGVVEKYVGSSFDVVKTVYAAIPDIARVSENIQDVSAVADNVNALLEALARPNITVSSTAPVNPQLGDVWVDLS